MRSNTEQLADRIRTKSNLITEIKEAYHKSKDISFRSSAGKLIRVLHNENSLHILALKARIAYGIF